MVYLGAYSYVMAFIRDEHTYINRVQGIVGGFIHHWNYLKSKGEM